MRDGPIELVNLMPSYSFVPRDSCPACGSARQTTLYRRGFDEEPVAGFIRDYYKKDPQCLAGETYELARCQDCALVFQRWVGDDQFLGQLYGVWISGSGHPDQDDQYRRDLKAPLLSRDAHEIFAASAVLGVPRERMTTLDYGMGWALWARIAHHLGCRSFGCDLAAERGEFARSHGVSTVDEDEIPASMFHFINTDQVFEHVTDPGDLAVRLAKALAPGGILKISVPSGERVDSVVEALRSDRWNGDHQVVMPVQPLEHINCFTARSLDILARKAGLEPIFPPLRKRYAFLGEHGTIDVRDLRRTAKEIIRPVHQFSSRTNLYRWFQKPRDPRGACKL